MGTLTPTASPTITGNPTTVPTVHPTPAPTMDFENPCNSPPLARKSYYFEPGRIWFVAVSGSWREYLDSEEKSGSAKNGFTYEYDERYLYDFDIIDEYGGPTFAPTLAPTFSETPVFLPSDFIADPFRRQYDKIATTSFSIMLAGVMGFVATRWYFHRKENRDVGKWLF